MKNTDTMQEDMTNLMLSCEGLGLIKPALQAKADLEAGMCSIVEKFTAEHADKDIKMTYSLHYL